MPKLVIKIPPFFFIVLIYFSLSDFFLSSNYMILGAVEHHLLSSACQYDFIVAGTTIITFLIYSESKRPLRYAQICTVLPNPISSPSTPPLFSLYSSYSHVIPLF